MEDSRRTGTPVFDELDYDLGLMDDDAAPSRLAGIRKNKAAKAGSDRYRPARLRTTPNWTRIAAAGLMAIVVLFLIVFAVRAMMHQRTVSSYRDYLVNTKEITDQSNAQGRRLRDLLTQPAGRGNKSVVQQLAQITEQAQVVSRKAKKIEAPESMRQSQRSLELAMQYRASGMASYERSLASGLQSANKQAAALAVAQAAQRLRASDIVYSDSFVLTARNVLTADEVTGLSIPESIFVSDPEFESPKSIELMLARLATRGGSSVSGNKATKATDGKLHGNGVQAVVVSPSGQTLSADVTTEIKASDNTSFEVTVQNQGEAQETQVPVTVTIKGTSSEPQKLSGTIERIDPGQTAALKLSLKDVPTFGEILTVTVQVGAVAGEKNLDNNAASFPVLFKL